MRLLHIQAKKITEQSLVKIEKKSLSLNDSGFLPFKTPFSDAKKIFNSSYGNNQSIWKRIKSLFFQDVHLVDGPQAIFIPFWIRHFELAYEVNAQVHFKNKSSIPLISLIDPGYFSSPMSFELLTHQTNCHLASSAHSDLRFYYPIQWNDISESLDYKPNAKELTAITGPLQVETLDLKPIEQPSVQADDIYYGSYFAQNSLKLISQTPFSDIQKKFDLVRSRIQAHPKEEEISTSYFPLYLPFYVFQCKTSTGFRFKLYINGLTGEIQPHPRPISVVTTTISSIGLFQTLNILLPPLEGLAQFTLPLACGLPILAVLIANFSQVVYLQKEERQRNLLKKNNSNSKQKSFNQLKNTYQENFKKQKESFLKLKPLLSQAILTGITEPRSYLNSNGNKVLASNDCLNEKLDLAQSKEWSEKDLEKIQFPTRLFSKTDTLDIGLIYISLKSELELLKRNVFGFGSVRKQLKQLNALWEKYYSK